MSTTHSNSEKAILLFEQLREAQIAQLRTTNHTEKQEYQREIHRIVDELRLEGM